MGLLSALGSLAPNDDGSLNGLQRFGMSLDDNNAPIAQSNLAQLAKLRAQGVTNPQQILSSLAQYDPQYAEKAADIQAKNPLATMLQGNTSGGSTNSGVPLASLSGDDLLAALPPAIASQVKGYAEGRIQPSPMMMRTAQGQQLMQLVSQYDPNFDAVNYNARANTRKSFTSGPDANNITALNTAMGHAASLQDAYTNLDNGDYAWLNKARNATESALGDTSKQTAMADVGTKAHALSEELAKVFRSTGMAESDVKAWEQKIDTSATPATSKAVISGAVDLMNSRLDALGEKYNQGMGTSKKGIELLSPKAQAAYQKLMGSPAPETGVTGNMPSNVASQSQSQITEGVTATNPKTGAKIVFKGGKWQPL